MSLTKGRFLFFPQSVSLSKRQSSEKFIIRHVNIFKSYNLLRKLYVKDINTLHSTKLNPKDCNKVFNIEI